MNCPKCQTEMKGIGSRYNCPACHTEYQVKFTCRVCGSEPEEISSCGSVGYFCPSCRELRSRTSMDKDYQELYRD
ncbi:MAG: zinc-ribbon domain-containing protein [Spirochaetaceae bacterium]|nr:zinc-ribbon domain-containing protein [Spirochaetaceae bacterium]MDT8296713.1 zinc-ribbon domain-containing protein [Spirochaetaceae bacterium]